jgi:hypothetical protein
MKENFYKKFRFKQVKLSNIEKPSPKFVAPGAPIPFYLTNLKFFIYLSFFII